MLTNTLTFDGIVKSLDEKGNLFLSELSDKKRDREFLVHVPGVTADLAIGSPVRVIGSLDGSVYRDEEDYWQNNLRIKPEQVLPLVKKPTAAPVKSKSTSPIAPTTAKSKSAPSPAGKAKAGKSKKDGIPF